MENSLTTITRGLKQKKMYENQREQTRNQQFNVDQVMFATENLKETADTVDAMKDANKALKKQFKAINISQVDDLQDDMADLPPGVVSSTFATQNQNRASEKLC